MVLLEYIELNEKKVTNMKTKPWGTKFNLRQAVQTLTIIINVPAGVLLEFK